MRLFRKAALRKRFFGDWSHRIGDLFECGVDFRGRSALDAGCNMGVLAYEVAKHEPRFIHGLDRRRDFIRTARMIFLGVPVESRFDRVDLSRDRSLRSVLLPQYDIVVFLSVYHQLRRSRGADAATRTLRTLLSKCSEDFIFRVPQAFLPESEATVIEAGFEKTFSGQMLEQGSGADSRFHAYHRVAPRDAAPRAP